MERRSLANAQPATSSAHRPDCAAEYPFTALQTESADARIADQDFDFIRNIAKNHAGISIADHKRHMVSRRLGKRLRSLGIESPAAYCAYLKKDSSAQEIEALINALTTNKTEFFREKHHFDHLERHALPDLIAKHRANRTRRLRIWSAGCSSGEEPYSAAMVLLSSFQEIASWDARILATDIDSEIIEKARAAAYDEIDTHSIPARFRNKFLKHGGEGMSEIRISDSIRSLVTFLRLNLHADWPMQGPFDIIFCRNVVIYFDRPTQSRLFDRFANILRPGGYLYIGHSESLYKVSNRFELKGQSIYQRIS
jgi:chemotaxis protein methyltransferase CheR